MKQSLHALSLRVRAPEAEILPQRAAQIAQLREELGEDDFRYLIEYISARRNGEALAEARKIAEVIAGNGPLAVQAMKRSVRETEGLPETEALAKELEIGWPILSTEDAKEGPMAFMQKRKPNFKGA